MVNALSVSTTWIQKTLEHLNFRSRISIEHPLPPSANLNFLEKLGKSETGLQMVIGMLMNG